MIESPDIVEFQGQSAAVIHLNFPREDIRTEMQPAINEVLGVLTEQGMSPIGPLFAHHLTQSNETFDFEVGFPVSQPFSEVGRVQNSRLPSGTMAHICHRGPYEDLFSTWREFDEWFNSNEALQLNLRKGETLFEIYTLGPETTANVDEWRTDLYQTLSVSLQVENNDIYG